MGLEGGYHGDTFGAMSVSRDPLFFGRFEPLLFQAEIVPPSAERLDDALKKHAGKVAAVIVEPLVQGAGGMRMHSAQELGEMAAVARNHGVLFIADEAVTGGGRTGELWAHRAAGIAPDLICAAKTWRAVCSRWRRRLLRRRWWHRGTRTIAAGRSSMVIPSRLIRWPARWPSPTGKC